MLSIRSCIAAAGVTIALNATPTAAKTSDLSRWHAACAGTPVVSERTGNISEAEIERGMRVLHGAGLLEPVTRFDISEACLSAIASAEVEFPIIVLEKRLPDDRRGWPGTTVNQLSDFLVRELLVDRISAANINLRAESPFSPNTSMEQRLFDNRGALYSAHHARSYSASGQSVCLVAMHVSPIADDMPSQNPYAWSLLDKSDRRMIRSSGDAVEFWHEVAHCQPEYALRDLAEKNVAANELTSWADKRQKESAQCDPAIGNALLAEMDRQLKAHSDDPNQAIRNTLAAGGFSESDAMDHHTHWALLSESLADEWAKKQVSARGIYQSNTCSAAEVVSHPWDRLRLAWSIREPDARYMTWLLPWIQGIPETTQYQVMADAYEGSLLAAEDLLPKAIFMELTAQREGRPDVYGLGTPKSDPDESRARQWKQWMMQNLSGQPAIGK